MDYKRLTDEELYDFTSRIVVQIGPKLTQQVTSLILELCEYRTKIENGTLVFKESKDDKTRKEYKRLTKYNEYNHNAEVYAYTVENEDFYFDGIKIVNYEHPNLAQEIIDKLALLEDKIENGTLIMTPCKVGDKVYKIDTILCEYYEHEVGGFSVENGELIILDCIDNRYKASELCFSKAEAEAKLKELQGE